MDYWAWHTDKVLLQPDEILVTSATGVALYDGESKTQWKRGKAMLTTHRLLYQELDSRNTTLQLSLEDVWKSGESPSAVNGFAFKSDKMVVPLPGGKYTKLSFRSGGMKEFQAEMHKTLQRKLWQKSAPAAAPANVASASPAALSRPQEASDHLRASASMVGIAGVMRQSAERSHMQETFKDIDDVMAKASSLVSNIRQLKDRATASDRAASQTQEDRVAIESIEATLGLGTMVSASDAPSHGRGQKHFHAELATELHGWMTHPRNDKMFGEMPFVPLIELFALYNRARSGDLVAPDDVLQACKVMAKQSYSVYSLEQLSSGRMVLARKDDTIILAKLVSLLGPMIASANRAHSKVGHVPTGARTIATSSTFPRTASQLKSVNEVQLANLLQVATAVARDLLVDMTARGYLCTCSAGHGCSTYYWNVFVL